MSLQREITRAYTSNAKDGNEYGGSIMDFQCSDACGNRQGLYWSVFKEGDNQFIQIITGYPDQNPNVYAMKAKENPRKDSLWVIETCGEWIREAIHQSIKMTMYKESKTNYQEFDPDSFGTRVIELFSEYEEDEDV